jgi:ERF superfamily
MSSTDIDRPADQSLAVQHPEPPTDLLSILAQAVVDPRMDVAKMERLLEMHRQVTEDQRRVAFAAAMARLQAVLPQITKEGRIVVSGTERSRYARIEDIDQAIRPLLAAEGFSLAFDTEAKDHGLLITGKISHAEGHSETRSLLLPLDAQGAKSPVQGVGSTVAYGRRYLVKMIFNLVEKGEDDDGQGGSQPISEAQAADIQALMDEVKTDQGRFLVFMGVGEVKDILQKDVKKAINALETKRRGAKA